MNSLQVGYLSPIPARMAACHQGLGNEAFAGVLEFLLHFGDSSEEVRDPSEVVEAEAHDLDPEGCRANQSLLVKPLEQVLPQGLAHGGAERMPPAAKWEGCS